MHIITKRRITEAKNLYSNSESVLAGWLRVVEDNEFRSFAELKAACNSVDKVGDLIVFDIGGNKLRLIASTHFNRQKLFIRHILTHKEYDKGKWKE